MDLQEEKGLSYMFITHDLSVVKHISSHIAVMYLGQCVEYAPTKELFAHPRIRIRRRCWRRFPSSTSRGAGKRIETIQGEVVSPINPAPGCRFVPRCKYASEECHQPQELRDMGNGHFVACMKK